MNAHFAATALTTNWAGAAPIVVAIFRQDPFAQPICSKSIPPRVNGCFIPKNAVESIMISRPEIFEQTKLQLK